MPTLTRTPPWQRNTEPAQAELQSLLADYEARHPGADTELIERAHFRAVEAHRGQRRKSGEPYIHHPIAVARIIAELGLDEWTVAAALLHDVIEDTETAASDLAEEFGPEIAELVEGCTKLDRVRFESKEEQQAASMRKMLVAIASDIRVLAIKLADRLHNMRTLAALPAWKQHRIAQETLDVYAPLAHRLGMQAVKTQLEDLAFAALHPKRFAEIDQMVAARDPERDIYLEQVLGVVETKLLELGIPAKVSGRPKHLWSIYEKMVVKGREFDDIYDLVGMRVIVDSVKDCYAAVGCIHATWKPVVGRFKDYIAMPKFNLYQSLHTTVIGPQGLTLEVQIRTAEMDARAEFGVAAHVDYKLRASDELDWMRRIVDLEREAEGDDDFLDDLRYTLEQDEVFVFTPKGDVLTLPAGATPIDFAYAVHTEVGHACTSAKVDGRLVPLDTKLQSGDTVEVMTAKVEGAGPSQDWLQFVASHRAQTKIRQWYLREQREDAKDSGREQLIAALRREGLPVRQIIESPVLPEIAEAMNLADRDSLFAQIGEGHVSAKSVAERVARQLRDGDTEHEERVPSTARRVRRNRKDRSKVGVHVEGLDDVLVRLSRCCTPVPPDQIMGFVTRGRGVSVHRTDCANAESLAEAQVDRLIDVEWDGEQGADFIASIEIKALDRKQLLRDVASSLAAQQVNIVSCQAAADSERVTRMQFEVEAGDASHLDSVLASIRAIDSVYDAYRILPGASD